MHKHTIIFRISLLVLLSYPISLTAQRFEGGFLGGIVASQIDGDTYWGYNKFGFSGGAYVSTPLSQKSNIQLEIKYIRKGANKSATEQDPVQFTRQLNYIELPVLVQLTTSKKIAWEGGVGVGYLYSFTESDATGLLRADQYADLKPLDINIVLGMNYALTDHLSANVRFSYSLLPITASVPQYTQHYKSGFYNNLFNISLYYNLGKK